MRIIKYLFNALNYMISNFQETRTRKIDFFPIYFLRHRITIKYLSSNVERNGCRAIESTFWYLTDYREKNCRSQYQIKLTGFYKIHKFPKFVLVHFINIPHAFSCMSETNKSDLSLYIHNTLWVFLSEMFKINNATDVISEIASINIL